VRGKQRGRGGEAEEGVRAFEGEKGAAAGVVRGGGRGGGGGEEGVRVWHCGGGLIYDFGGGGGLVGWLCRE
jgi:hypothetical protein